MENNYLHSVKEIISNIFSGIFENKNEHLDDKLRNEESITLNRLKKDGYVPHYIREEIANREGYKVSEEVRACDIHLIEYDPLNKMISYKFGEDIKKARLIDNLFKDE